MKSFCHDLPLSYSIVVIKLLFAYSKNTSTHWLQNCLYSLKKNQHKQQSLALKTAQPSQSLRINTEKLAPNSAISRLADASTK
jgi:hypothetical protein